MTCLKWVKKKKLRNKTGYASSHFAFSLCLSNVFNLYVFFSDLNMFLEL